jgi:hypothetical protein
MSLLWKTLQKFWGYVMISCFIEDITFTNQAENPGWSTAAYERGEWIILDLCAYSHMCLSFSSTEMPSNIM